MKQTIRSFVGIDVHKETISLSVAEDGRSGTVRFIGVIPNTPEAVQKMAKQLARHGELDFCYEASGCGYGIHRQLTGLGHKCTVVAPSMIPRRPGERIKTDRRDSEKLAILHRSGDLTPVWVPDTTHEALSDLVRARVDASMHLMRARQQLLAFLLRHGRSYPTGKHWTQRHRSWLAGQVFKEQAHGIVFHDYLETVWTAQQRRDALIEKISAMVASWSLGPTASTHVLLSRPAPATFKPGSSTRECFPSSSEPLPRRHWPSGTTLTPARRTGGDLDGCPALLIANRNTESRTASSLSCACTAMSDNSTRWR